MWDKILGIFKSDAIKQIGDTVDGLITSDEEKSAAKVKLTEVVMTALNGAMAAQASVIQTEMKGNFLQRSWRPVLMLTFGAILVSMWFGWTDPNIEEALELKLLSIVELGLGGYVIGRSVEQTAKIVTKNVDMPFLKKKDRK
jgi:hypothetical protein